MLAGAVGAMSCGSENPPAVRSTTQTTLPSFLLRSNAPLILAGVPLSDTVERGGPVVLAYFFRNNGPSAALRNDTHWIEFDVIAPSGARVTPVKRSDDVFDPTAGETILPTGGVLGQVVDLTCVRLLYVPAEDSPCYYRYSFAQGGDYRIVVRYSPPNFRSEGEPDQRQRQGTKWQPLSSDTVRVTIR